MNFQDLLSEPLFVENFARLTEKQRAFLEHYVKSQNPIEACHAVRAAYRTYYRWLKNRAFRYCVGRIRYAMFLTTLEIAESAVAAAFRRLAEFIEDEDKEFALKAITITLDKGLPFLEAHELSDQVAILREMLRKIEKYRSDEIEVKTAPGDRETANADL